MAEELKRAPITPRELISHKGATYSVPVLRSLVKSGRITPEGQEALRAWDAKQGNRPASSKA